MRASQIVLGSVLFFASGSNVIAAENPTTFADAYQLYMESVENSAYDDAKRYSKTAYELGLEQFGKDHANTALLAFNHSQMLRISGSRKEGASFATTAREIAERVHGDSSTNLIQFLETEAQALLAINESDRAEKVADRALGLILEGYGEESEEYADILVILARIESGNGWGSKSRNRLEKALSIFTETLGAEHAKVASTKYHLGRYNMAWDRHKRAIEFFNDAIRTWSDDRDKHLVDIGSARAFLVSSYTEIGEIDKATEQCQAIGMEMIERGEGNADAEPLYRKVPSYPSSAARRGVEGKAQFSFTIDEYGFVKNIRLESDDGRKDLARAAEEALAEWRYAPAVIDGKFVPRHNNQVIISFALDN